MGCPVSGWLQPRTYEHISPHLSMPHPWKCPVPRSMGSWAPCSNGRCLCPWQKGWNWMFLEVLSLNHLTLKLFFSYRMALPCTCSWGCWAPLQAELPCSGCCCHQCPCSSLARGGVSVLQPAIVGNAPPVPGGRASAQDTPVTVLWGLERASWH